MIDTDLFERICEFNKLRRKGTHYLAIEDVNFDDLEQAARSMFMLGDDIQRKYLTIKVGPVETREEFLVKEEKAST